MFTGHSAKLSESNPPNAVAEAHRPIIIVREYNHARLIATPHSRPHNSFGVILLDYVMMRIPCP